MVIVNEGDVPYSIHESPYARTLKLLLSPKIHREIETIGVGITILPSSSKSDWAKHEEGEMFYVVYGTGNILVDDKEYNLKPGTTVWVPPFTFHQLINNSGDTIKILWVLSPPGREANILG